MIDMYYYGRGVEKNYQKVIEYGEEFEKNNNDIYVAYYLGNIYFYGKDVEKDYKKAKMYFEKSIDDRYDDSYYHLALIYRDGGYGVEKDEEKFKEYFSIIESDFYRAIIYYTLALGSEETYESILKEQLENEKGLMDALYDNFPKEHIAVKYYNKIKYLTDAQYDNFMSIVKPIVSGFFRMNYYECLNNLESEQEVEILIEKIVLMG